MIIYINSNEIRDIYIKMKRFKTSKKLNLIFKINAINNNIYIKTKQHSFITMNLLGNIIETGSIFVDDYFLESISNLDDNLLISQKLNYVEVKSSTTIYKFKLYDEIKDEILDSENLLFLNYIRAEELKEFLTLNKIVNLDKDSSFIITKDSFIISDPYYNYTSKTVNSNINKNLKVPSLFINSLFLFFKKEDRLKLEIKKVIENIYIIATSNNGQIIAECEYQKYIFNFKCPIDLMEINIQKIYDILIPYKDTLNFITFSTTEKSNKLTLYGRNRDISFSADLEIQKTKDIISNNEIKVNLKYILEFLNSIKKETDVKFNIDSNLIFKTDTKYIVLGGMI